MPWSAGPEIKDAVLDKLSNPKLVDRIKGVLDIGAGAGQWRDASIGKEIGNVEWAALEGYSPYVGRFGLKMKYDRLIIRDMRQIKYGGYPGWVFIFGDVLEHLDRSDALGLMKRACSMGTVVVVMPFRPSVSEEQDAVNGNEMERHRYVWGWPEWIEAIQGYEPEIISEPPGQGRNKGAVICWHRSHRI